MIVRSFHAAAQTVYRVQAVDGSGIYGKPSQPVVVLPTKRPKDLPKALPRWAWSLFTWQHERRHAPEGGAEEAARLVLALGRLAARAVPPQALDA